MPLCRGDSNIVFRPDLFAGVLFQIFEILAYVCGLKQEAAVILKRNPNGEMGAIKGDSKYPIGRLFGNTMAAYMMDDSGWVVDLALAPPSLHDNTADADRLQKEILRKTGIGPVAIDLGILRELPARLKNWGYRCRCVFFKSLGGSCLIDIMPPEDPATIAGIAMDLGTTRVVMSLVDLVSGESLLETVFDNPQCEIGPDILERAHYADRPGGLARLNGLIIKAVNEEIGRICRKAGMDRDRVYLMAVAGNTSMTHLFAGISPRGIIREPYIPAVNRFGAVRAEDLGIQINRRGRVFMFPNVGSYFGGDLIAGALCAGFHESKDISILVDVGTNAEVLLGNSEWLVACAGAAGPALEGGVSEIGMTAGPGVIDAVAVDPETGEFQIRTIGDQPPKGICGSGMIDLAAALFLSGMMDIRGRLVPDACGDRFREIDGVPNVVLVPEDMSSTGEALVISQVDIDSLVRSKAAMYTILETLLNYVGIGFDDIKTFYVAGTFGSLIKPRSAISIGMIPDLPEETYRSIGNASLKGAARLLMERGAMDAIASIRDRITYLELNVNQEFMNRFSAAKFFPHTDAARFPSVSFRQ